MQDVCPHCANRVMHTCSFPQISESQTSCLSIKIHSVQGCFFLLSEKEVEGGALNLIVS